MWRNPNAKCFIYCTIGHLRRDCRQEFLNNIFSGKIKNKRYQSSGLCRKCDKGKRWNNECRLTKDIQGKMIPSGNSMVGGSHRPLVKSGLVIPIHYGRHVSPGKLKNLQPSVKKPYCSG